MGKNSIKSNLSDVKLSYINKYLTGNKVIDIGSGKCHYLKWLAQTKKSLSLTSLDKIDLPNHYKSFSYLKTDLEQPLSIPSNTFTTILAFDIIEHIRNEPMLLNELYRICSFNGCIIGSVPHDNDGFLPSYNLTFKHRSDLTHVRYYTPQSLKRSLLKAKFTNITIGEEGGIAPQVFAEFFPNFLQYPIKKCIGLLRRMKIINTRKLSSDLFFCARKIVHSKKESNEQHQKT